MIASPWARRDLNYRCDIRRERRSCTPRSALLQVRDVNRAGFDDIVVLQILKTKNLVIFYGHADNSQIFINMVGSVERLSRKKY